MVLASRAPRRASTATGSRGRRMCERVYGNEIYGVFREIKAAFDPSGIMNPGKKIVSKAETRRRGHQPALRPQLLDLRPAHAAATSRTASTRARSRSATGARSARAWSAPPCAPPTRPRGGSTPRPGQRPTCCATSSRASFDSVRHLRRGRHPRGHRLLHRVRHVRGGVPLERQHPQADAGGQEQVPGSPQGHAGRTCVLGRAELVSKAGPAWRRPSPTPW